MPLVVALWCQNIDPEVNLQRPLPPLGRMIFPVLPGITRPRPYENRQGPPGPPLVS